MLKRREVEQVNYAGKVSLDKIFAKWYRNKWLLKKGETLLSETSNLYPIYLWALAHYTKVLKPRRFPLKNCKTREPKV